MRPAAAAASSAFLEISWYDRSRILSHKGQSSGQLNARPKKRRGEGAYKFRWSMAIVSLPTAGMYTLACKRKRNERESVLSDIVQKRGEGKEGRTGTHLGRHVRLEVLLSGNVDAHDSFPKLLRRNLELSSRNSANDDVALRQSLVKRHLGRSSNVRRLERSFLLLLLSSSRSRASLGVLDNTVDVGRENAGAVVGEQRSERSSNDFGSVDDCDGLSPGAVTVRERRVVDLCVLERLDLKETQSGS